MKLLMRLGSLQRGYDLRSYMEFYTLLIVVNQDSYWQADRELASNGKSPEKLKGAGSFLMKVFGVLAVCFSAQTICSCRRVYDTLFIFSNDPFSLLEFLCDENNFFLYTSRGWIGNVHQLSTIRFPL